MSSNYNPHDFYKIANIIKQFLNVPVIYFNLKNYGKNIINNLYNIEEALLANNDEMMLDIIKSFHNEWLIEVEELEKFKDKLPSIPQSMMCDHSISFTINSIKSNQESFINYFSDLSKLNYEKLKFDEHFIINRKKLAQMDDTVLHKLDEKQKIFTLLSPGEEFNKRVEQELEQLLSWLDRFNNNIALEFSSILKIDVKQEFNRFEVLDTIRNSKNTLSASGSEHAMTMFSNEDKIMSEASGWDLEIVKVIAKIGHLEQRIFKLHEEKSSAQMALKKKIKTLHKKLEFLLNVREKICLLPEIDLVSTASNLKEILTKPLLIFYHKLPKVERELLISDLIKIWKDKIAGQHKNSYISIFSCDDTDKMFYDDLGSYQIDKHDRKIYKRNNRLYQADENNQLVEVMDDDKHVYFYDNCGRYYIDNNGKRIYKAHKDDDEYILNNTGLLVKFKEVINGVEYYYDNLGRNFQDEAGNRVYKEHDSASEYEDDGLGNLIRKRSNLNFTTCQYTGLFFIEESVYLRETVSAALKTCLHNVVLAQPIDPIGYLADCLVKYDSYVKAENKRRKEFDLIKVERKRREQSEVVGTVPGTEIVSSNTSYQCLEG